ncbi:MAG: SDR family oxidoreductase [Anaeromyxobacter sp.]|nr:SDR family oxidoreductase [Anaeromyxobacter sp.]MBL0276026.1 SDR family oxidoreductase [Anaeromyxobacter sp.]
MSVVARYQDLAGRRALVTGASSGIGLGIAEALLEQGATVAVHYRSSRGAAEALCARFPGRAFPLQAELGEEEGCVRLVAEAAAALGGLDQLVHNAGMWNDGAIATITAATLEELFRVNTFSAFYLVRQAVPHLGRTGRGNVIFIGSTAGQRGEAGHGHYAASKGALQSLAMSLAVELGPATRVNVVSPGWVRTPMAEAELREVGPRISGALPNRRVAEVDDVVQAVLFLASEASGHLVGENLGVSGGALLVVPRGQIAAWP